MSTVAALLDAIASLRSEIARSSARMESEIASLRADLAAIPPCPPIEPPVRLSQVQPPVTVVASDTDADPAICCANALTADPTQFFFSADHPNQWLCYDLSTARCIRPSGYEIRSANFPAGSAHLRSWVIEGSLDCRSWTEIDRREDSSELNAPGGAVLVPLSAQQDFRAIRLRQLGQSHCGNHALSLAFFDVFGFIGVVSPAPALDSAILTDFPAIFDQFRAKKFTLLWRGSRDGFLAGYFHAYCDGHANALVVVLDRNGNIFGGFTPLAWDSVTGNHAGDTDRRSFLFTLKNPSGVPPRIFRLKEEGYAIFCYSQNGPSFGDILIEDHCNCLPLSSAVGFGDNYENDGIGGPPGRNQFFTGSEAFIVKEIEVFELTD
jgi:hypothetical protein